MSISLHKLCELLWRKILRTILCFLQLSNTLQQSYLPRWSTRHIVTWRRSDWPVSLSQRVLFPEQTQPADPGPSTPLQPLQKFDVYHSRPRFTLVPAPFLPPVFAYVSGLSPLIWGLILISPAWVQIELGAGSWSAFKSNFPFVHPMSNELSNGNYNC